MTDRSRQVEAVRQELLRHAGGWIDNGNMEKCRCGCGHRPMLGEYHGDHVAEKIVANVLSLRVVGDD